MDWNEYKRKCYIFARSQERLRAEGLFDREATVLIEEAARQEEGNGIAYLESMIVRGEEYRKMDERYCPVLVYVGDPICYGILDYFARELGLALEKRGLWVEYFNPMDDNVSDIAQFVGRRFRAVIGIQTFVFSVRMKDGRCVHDLIYGPKYNMFLDHPIWLKKHLDEGPADYTILTHDTNYVNFIRKYFPKVGAVELLPPAGKRWEGADGVTAGERRYDLTFVGTYHDWRRWAAQVRELNRVTGGLARRLLAFIMGHLDMTWEDALRHALVEIVEDGENGEAGTGRMAAKGGTCREIAEKALANPEGFVDLLFEVKPVCFLASSYIRERILDTVIQSGLRLHVFSDSFDDERFFCHENLVRHGERSPEESLEIYAESKVSLNILSWHKAGMTERMANMMLNGAVMVTDRSEYLSRTYVEGEDYVAFSLDEIDGLPATIRALLADGERQEAIRTSAYGKARERETWDARAGVFLQLVGEEDMEK